MRISDSHAWNVNNAVNKLKAPLPPHRVDEVEVFDASVHAVVHEHDWKVLSSQVSITDPLKIDVLFQCSGCRDVVRRQANQLDFI